MGREVNHFKAYFMPDIFVNNDFVNAEPFKNDSWKREMFAGLRNAA